MTSTDIDFLTVSLNAGETLTVVGTPTTSSPAARDLGTRSEQQRCRHRDGPGRRAQNAVIETAPVTTTGTYTIAIFDQWQLGLYSIQATSTASSRRYVERHDRHGPGPHRHLLRARHRRCRSTGRGQPQPARPGHAGFLLVRPDPGPDGHGRGREPERQGRPDHHRRRQWQRPGHGRGRSDQRQPVDRELRRPGRPARTTSRSPATRASSTAWWSPAAPTSRSSRTTRITRLRTSPARAACWATSPRPPRRSTSWMTSSVSRQSSIRSARPIRPPARSSGPRSPRPAARSTTRSASTWPTTGPYLYYNNGAISATTRSTSSIRPPAPSSPRAYPPGVRYSRAWPT